MATALGCGGGADSAGLRVSAAGVVDGPGARVLSLHPGRPVVVAHRGASGVAPENTLAAYREAGRMGVVAAETDVRLTADRAVVALHDATMDRTTDGTGPVAELTLAEVRATDAGVWAGPTFAGERVPLLSEIYGVLPEETVLCVELKAGAGLEEAVRSVLDAGQHRRRTVFFGFSADKIALVRMLMPDVPALFLASRRPATARYSSTVVEDAQAIGAHALGFNQLFLQSEHVQAAHAAGMPVFVYTVDTPQDVLRMVEMGVDGLITNVPDQVTSVLDAMPR